VAALDEHPAPPFDAELGAVLAANARWARPTITADLIPAMRTASITPPIDAVLRGRAVSSEDRSIPGPVGAPEIQATIFRPTARPTSGLGFLHVHGGGMIIGDRFVGVGTVLDWVEEFGAVVVTFDYRLAPESPDPAPIDDCYAALLWTSAHTDELGITPDRLVVVGASAGGGLAAGAALLARDNGGPRLAAQILMYPMIDDRNDTSSSIQIDGKGIWDRGSNDTGWDALLGSRRRTDDVSIYAAPARATHLGGLPPAYIDCGSSEVFRDEDVAYASLIWASGGIAELHVWPGGFHGFDVMAPDAALSQAMRQTRTAWVRRVLVQ
jgi:acetyl esterase/lipase